MGDTLELSVHKQSMMLMVGKCYIVILIIVLNKSTEKDVFRSKDVRSAAVGEVVVVLEF